MTTPKVPGRLLAWVALLIGLTTSVLANIAAARPAIGPRLSSGVAPVLVVLAAAMLERVPLATARWWQRWLAPYSAHAASSQVKGPQDPLP